MTVTSSKKKTTTATIVATAGCTSVNLFVSALFFDFSVIKRDYTRQMIKHCQQKVPQA